jgi:hypothetical protein
MFYGNMTQAEIGEQLAISQMHVSRLLSQALTYLRERILGSDPAPSVAGPSAQRQPASRSAACAPR